MLLLHLSPQPICFEGKRAEQGGVGAKEERERWRTEEMMKVLGKALLEARWCGLGLVSLPSGVA